MRLCDLVTDRPMPDDYANIAISGLCADSRTVKQDWLFVAISGNDSDGHDHIDSAIANGAVAVLGEKDLSNLSVPYIQSESIRADFAKACARFWPKRPAIQVAITGTKWQNIYCGIFASNLAKATWDAASWHIRRTNRAHGP